MEVVLDTNVLVAAAISWYEQRPLAARWLIEVALIGQQRYEQRHLRRADLRVVRRSPPEPARQHRICRRLHRRNCVEVAFHEDPRVGDGRSGTGGTTRSSRRR